MPVDGTLTTKVKKPKLSIRITSRAQHGVLAAFRDKCGSVEAAAKEIGISKATFANWMNFKTTPCAHSLEKHQHKYLKIIPRFEEAVGAKFRDVFPDIPREALRSLSEKRIVTNEVEVERITRAVEREKLSYTVNAAGLAEQVEAKEAIELVLGSLSFREREIIKLRYGLGKDEISYSLEEVGHIFKITRERVRQIEMKAFQKLCGPGRAAMLVSHVDDVHQRPNFSKLDKHHQEQQAKTLKELVSK